jgi:hypothetical protein
MSGNGPESCLVFGFALMVNWIALGHPLPCNRAKLSIKALLATPLGALKFVVPLPFVNRCDSAQQVAYRSPKLIQPSPTDHALKERRKSQARTIGIASVIWAGSVFLSRIMGLVREQIIGRTLGASREADLYFASFTLPDFLNYLLAAGALSIVFIPIFLEYFERGDQQGGWEPFSVIANFILLAGSIGIALLMVFARPLAGLVAPGFSDPSEVDTLVRLIRIILPAQFFLVIGGLLSAALQAQDLHLLPAMAPLVYSAGIIVGGLVGAHAGIGVDGFAWGVLAGSALGPFGMPLCGCLKTRMRWYLILSFRNADLRHYLWLSFPIMIGFSIVVVGRAFVHVAKRYDKVEFEYDYHRLKRWLLKMCFNSARIHTSRDAIVFPPLLPYIMGKSHALGRSVQLYVQLAYPDEIPGEFLDSTDLRPTIYYPMMNRVGNLWFEVEGVGRKMLRSVHLQSFSFYLAFFKPDEQRVVKEHFTRTLLERMPATVLLRASLNRVTLLCDGMNAWDSVADARNIEFVWNDEEPSRSGG